MPPLELLAEGTPAALITTNDAVVWLDAGDHDAHLEDHELEDEEDLDEEDEEGLDEDEPRARVRKMHGVVWTPKAGGPSRVLASRRRRGWSLGATERLVVFTEETAERYVLAAFTVGTSGDDTPKPLPFEPSLLEPARVGEGLLVASGDQLYVVSRAGVERELVGMDNRPTRTFRGGVEYISHTPRAAHTRLGMGAHLACGASHAYWTSTGDTTTEGALHHVPFSGGDSSRLVELGAGEGVGQLVVDEGTLYFEHYTQDTRVGEVLSVSVRAMSLATGVTRTVCTLDARLGALVGGRGVLYAVARSGGEAGLVRGHGATGRRDIVAPEVPAGSPLALDATHVYVGLRRSGVARVAR